MTIPTRYSVYETIKDSESLTDDELVKLLAKKEIVLAQDRFNKILLDLEILGLVKVSWLTKDVRRIEAIIRHEEEDPVEKENREAQERDYEASFPGSS